VTARASFVGALLWAAHVLLGLGLAAPCMTVVPRVGDLDPIGGFLGLVKDPHSYSVLSGIRALLAGDAAWIGALLFVFSVLFPLVKLVALRVALADAAEGRPPHRAQLALANIGKYSMADVFVVGLVVVASKSFPGGTEVVVRWGLYAFAGAALLTMFASARVHSSMRRASSFVSR